MNLRRCCVCFFLSGAMAWAGASQKEKGAAVTWGAECAGLRSRIWTEKRRFRLGEPIAVHYEIKNVSPKRQMVMHSGFWPNHRIDLLGPDGKPARRSLVGEQVNQAFTPGGTREKNVPVFIEPGKSDASWEAYDLSVYFVLPGAGTYTVQYLYLDGPGEEGLRSNKLEIELATP